MTDDQYRKFFTNKLNYYMAKTGKKQRDLIDELKLSSATISSWCTGKRLPRMGKIQLLADYLGIKKTDLIEEKPSIPPSHDYTAIKNLMPIKTKKFPLIGTIACGKPIMSEQHFESYVSGDANINADFCLRCKGDSMTGARIEDGEIVFIREQPDVENGEIAAVIIDDETTLIRINKNIPGYIQLMPENAKYEPIVVNLAEPDESRHMRIIGKAVAFQGDVV